MTRDQSDSDSKSFSKPSPKDMLFFGVFDGHSGWQTSKLLAEQLLPAVNRELYSVFRSEPEYVAAYLAKKLAQAHPDEKASNDGVREIKISKGIMEKMWNIVTWNNQHKRPVINNLDQDDDIVKLAIQNAFIKLDNQIVGRPLQMLSAYEAQRKSGDQSIPKAYGADVTPQQTASLQTLLPALSGSCALLAYIDTVRSK
jgi:pyruvate dehydrogenase phosphatase